MEQLDLKQMNALTEALKDENPPKGAGVDSKITNFFKV